MRRSCCRRWMSPARGEVTEEEERKWFICRRLRSQRNSPPQTAAHLPRTLLRAPSHPPHTGEAPTEGEPEPIFTESMAEMYARQGLNDQALHVHGGWRSRLRAITASGQDQGAESWWELVPSRPPALACLPATVTGGNRWSRSSTRLPRSPCHPKACPNRNATSADAQSDDQSPEPRPGQQRSLVPQLSSARRAPSRPRNSARRRRPRPHDGTRVLLRSVLRREGRAGTGSGAGPTTPPSGLKKTLTSFRTG